jgi:hypothetical protein
MKHRAAKFFVLLWLGWYLSGPISETIDFWDTPKEEMRDVLRNAGGTVVLVAAAICIGIALLRKSCERFRTLARVFSEFAAPAGLSEPVWHPLISSLPTHSPPVPLRI